MMPASQDEQEKRRNPLLCTLNSDISLTPGHFRKNTQRLLSSSQGKDRVLLKFTPLTEFAAHAKGETEMIEKEGKPNIVSATPIVGPQGWDHLDIMKMRPGLKYSFAAEEVSYAHNR